MQTLGRDISDTYGNDEILEEDGHVSARSGSGVFHRSDRAFDDAVFLRKRMFLTHTFPGCVFVRAMQTLGRDNQPHMAMT